MADFDELDFDGNPDDTTGTVATLDFAAVAQQLVAPISKDEEADITERIDFVEKIARGYGGVQAGLTCGWSIAKINRTLKDPEIINILELISEYKNDTVEYAILQAARAGNVNAAKMWALAKMPERGWVEKRTHVIEGQAQIDVVHSVKQALQETLRTPGAIAGLHAAYAEDDDILDVEVLDDDF